MVYTKANKRKNYFQINNTCYRWMINQNQFIEYLTTNIIIIKTSLPGNRLGFVLISTRVRFSGLTKNSVGKLAHLKRSKNREKTWNYYTYRFSPLKEHQSQRPSPHWARTSCVGCLCSSWWPDMHFSSWSGTVTIHTDGAATRRAAQLSRPALYNAFAAVPEAAQRRVHG